MKPIILMLILNKYLDIFIYLDNCTPLVFVCIHVLVCICVCVCEGVCVRVYECVYIGVCLCVHVSLCVRSYTYTYKTHIKIILK